MLKNLQTKALLLLLVLVGGELTVSAEEVTDGLNLALTGVTGTNYTAWSGKSSISDAVYAGNSAGGNDAIQLRSNNSNSGVVSTTSGGKVKKVVVTWNDNTAEGRTLNVYGKNTAYSAATDLYNSSNQGTSLGTIVNGKSTELTVDGDYAFIGFRSASGAMYLDKVEITWEVASATAPIITAEDVELAFDATNGTIAYSIENAVEGTTLTATKTAEWLTIGTISSAAVNFVATVNDGVAAREAEVTLTYGDVTKTIKVVQAGDPNAPGSKNNPYTVAQARSAIDANTGVTDVYVTGTVSGIVESKSGYITYTISADGTTNSDQLQVYKGKSYEGANFESENDILVDDVVVVKGNLSKYNDIYQFSAGSQLVSLQRPTRPTILLVDPSPIRIDAEGGEGFISVEFTEVDPEMAEVVMCDANGNEATYDWVVAELNSDYQVEYAIAANTGDARTAYLKIFGQDSEDNDVNSNIITITQAAYVAPVVITEDSYVKVTSADELTDGQYLIVYELSDGAGLAFDGSLETLDAVGNSIEVNNANGIITATADIQASAFTLASTEGGFTIASASGLYIGQTSDANGLKSNANTAYTNAISFNDDGTANIVSGGAYLRYNSASDQLRFRYYKSASYTRQEAIALYKFVEATTEEAPKATIGDAKWATYVAVQNVSFPTGCSAYIATAIKETSVTLTKVDAVAEGTPVVLNGEQGEYELEAVEAANCDNVEANMLRVVSADEAYTIKSGVYVLTRVGGTVGFYAYEGTNGLPEGRVYLQPETAGQSRNFLSLGNSEATGIVLNNAENGMSTEIFDLQGRRVEKVQKGLYIVNGKKMIIK